MMRPTVVVLVISVLLLVGSGILAQTPRDPTSVTTIPNVLSGEDVGIRVTGPAEKNGKVQGTLVVRINGKWVEVVTSSHGVVPLGK